MRKRKIKNRLKFGILLLGILLILTNCDKDETFITETNVVEKTEQEYDFLQKGFYSKEINKALRLGEDNFQVKWNTASIILFDKQTNVTMYEIEAFLKKNITSTSDVFDNVITYKLEVTKTVKKSTN